MLNFLTLKLDALTQKIRGENVNAISAPIEGYDYYGVERSSYAHQFPQKVSFILRRQS